ncbi:hypothetical protein Gohar_025227 [Gossypium harknessii]|uniref:Uncharacterized protein n=1 Tax=Gossypium harknessii TaxID=34285 RepID=A0A7J9HIB5_9ROSI|nr:hypothetical protein [Gossypium harknessii]
MLYVHYAMKKTNQSTISSKIVILQNKFSNR